MQVNPFARQKEMPLRLAEEIELEEVSPIPLVRVEPAPLFRAFRRVQQDRKSTPHELLEYFRREICSAVLLYMP